MESNKIFKVVCTSRADYPDQNFPTYEEASSYVSFCEQEFAENSLGDEDSPNFIIKEEEVL